MSSHPAIGGATRTRRTATTVALALGAVLTGSCGSAAGQPPVVGHVQGTALAGPTCPVERPDDPSCAPAPVTGTVQFRHKDSVVQATIDALGAFVADLPAGVYAVTIDVGAGPFPTCPLVDLVVKNDQINTLSILCDTGIR